MFAVLVNLILPVGCFSITYIKIVLFEDISGFVDEPNEKAGYFNIPASTTQSHIELLKKCGVKYVFGGHLHKNGTGHHGRPVIVTAAPAGKPLTSAIILQREQKLTGLDVKTK